MAKKLAVILCGSGYKDGSEIRESVSLLLALSQQDTHYQCFAPDDLQRDVVNCLTGESLTNEKRNILVESARIARGNIKPITTLDVKEYDGIIIPGGFGVAKNLCTFAYEGSNATVRPDVAQVLNAFHAAKKPIGAICIAPALIALAFKGAALTLTVGEVCEASQEIEKLGHKHEVCLANQCVIDHANKIVTTPAYMYDNASLAQIYKGIESLVREVIRL